MKIAIAGVGNCSSALAQALSAIEDGLIEAACIVPDLAEYTCPLEIVAAFDVSRAKVGKSLNDAITDESNCTTMWRRPKDLDVRVQAGILGDGIDGPLSSIIEVHEAVEGVTTERVTEYLSASGTDVLVLYLPAGSQAATDAYATAALLAGVSVVNCTPSWLGRSATWRGRFNASGLQLVGDDMKSHIGASALHHALLSFLQGRNVDVRTTYQLNVGGNSDFYNMTDPMRASTKRDTKFSAISAYIPGKQSIAAGPSDFVDTLRDRKMAHVHISGCGFMEMPFEIDVKLMVEDSPNAAGVAIEAVRLISAVREGYPFDVNRAMFELFKAPGLP